MYVGSRGGVAERFSQLDDDLRKGVVANDYAGPHGGKQFVAARNFSGPARQMQQHRHRFGLEVHYLIAAA